MKWVRTIGSAIVGVIAVVALVLTVVGFWARGTVFDESEVGAAVASALDEPGVTDALAARLTDSVMTAVDLESAINGVLPPVMQRITPAIVSGVERVVQERLTARLADPDTRAALVTVFEQSYGAFLDVLEGDGLVDGVSMAQGEVTVNFLPLVGEGLEALQQIGLLDDVTIPDMTRAGDPTQQIAELEDAFDRSLPDDFGQIVVYRSDSLAQAGETVDNAQRLLVTVQRAFWVLLAVTIVSLLGCVLLAHRRRRAILILLLGSAATFVIVRAIVNQVLDELPSIARAPAGQAALAAASTSLSDGLVAALGVGALLFVVAAALIYLLAPGSIARGGSVTSPGSSTLGSIVMVIALAAGVLVIVFAGFHLWSMILAIALTAIGMVFWARSNRDAAPAPQAEPEPPPDQPVLTD